MCFLSVDPDRNRTKEIVSPRVVKLGTRLVVTITKDQLPYASIGSVLVRIGSRMMLLRTTAMFAIAVNPIR